MDGGGWGALVAVVVVVVEVSGGRGSPLKNADTDSHLELEPPEVPLTFALFPCSSLPLAAAAAFVELSALTLRASSSSSSLRLPARGPPSLCSHFPDFRGSPIWSVANAPVGNFVFPEC